QTLRSRLAAVGGAPVERAADRVADAVLALPEVRSAGGVLACWSFGAEVSTRGLVGRLAGLGREVFLPRIDARRRDGVMSLHGYPCDMERLRFGLEQPAASAPALAPGEIDDRVDVALVLGLGFDRDGYRLGYGGGYFDRFLARHRAVPIGLGFDVQRVDSLPREAHDVPMACVVTEAGVYRPGRSPEGRVGPRQRRC
ncbi:MAG: 5-formyltetrahydrofolate cyclo-ligase, partial [Acidobacteriota bacterium]